MVKTVKVDVGKYITPIISDLDEITGLIKTLTSKVSAYNRKYKAKIRLNIDVTIDDNPVCLHPVTR